MNLFAHHDNDVHDGTGTLTDTVLASSHQCRRYHRHANAHASAGTSATRNGDKGGLTRLTPSVQLLCRS